MYPGFDRMGCAQCGRNIHVMPINVWTVTVAAAITALATGLGALPFAVFRSGMGRRWLGISNAIASGFMLAASVGPPLAGFRARRGEARGRAVLGGVFIFGFRKLIGDSETLVLGGSRARTR